jgi:hypothetical protein
MASFYFSRAIIVSVLTVSVKGSFQLAVNLNIAPLSQVIEYESEKGAGPVIDFKFPSPAKRF